MPVRLAYIASSAIPSRSANSIHVMQMCHAFGLHGHEVKLVLRNNRTAEQLQVDDLYAYYSVTTNFALVRLPVHQHRLAWVRNRFVLKRCLSDFDPDIVYSRDLVGAYVAARMGIPVVYEAHKPISESPRRLRLFRHLVKSKHLHRVVVITEALKQWFVESYPEVSNRLFVYPDCAAPSANLEPVVLDNHGAELSVGYVGHLYSGKGMELIYQLITLCPWAMFHIVGGTDSDIQHWCSQLRGSGNVIFHGHVPHADVIRYIQALDVVLLPNQPEVATFTSSSAVSSTYRGPATLSQDIGKWTSPLKLFEYMAVGKPIVASDLSVLREILKHRENCLLCPPDVPENWAEALRELNDDSDLRWTLGNTAQRQFLERYTWYARAGAVLPPIADTVS